jgi:hypothetical protein
MHAVICGEQGVVKNVLRAGTGQPESARARDGTGRGLGPPVRGRPTTGLDPWPPATRGLEPEATRRVLPKLVVRRRDLRYVGSAIRGQAPLQQGRGGSRPTIQQSTSTVVDLLLEPEATRRVLP